ncbi:MAG TPA: ABC transporter permease [Burkholderiaceae bacterium]|jgi:lipooligosaccharide transport system permease protein|nr:ABC transporter permease [Burkholderiaceae bacterium]
MASSPHSSASAANWRLFAPPRLSWRFVPVLRRHLLVWRKLALPSLLGNVADPLIMLLAFGYGLGRLLPGIDGVPYIVFLAAGSIMMSTMMAASFESLYSAFSRMHVQRTWDSLINAPLNLDDVLTAECLWAALKGCFSGVAIIAVVVALGLSSSPLLPLVLPVIALTGLTFGALGLCFNALARNYDFFTYYFTLALTPMTFISGVFFPVAQLPDWLQAISAVLPLTAAVALARPLVLGDLPADALTHVLVLCAYAAAAFYAALVLTRRRFRV